MERISNVNNLNVELNIDLNETLSPDSFSTILIHVIKYIAYNCQLIPCCYEGVSHLVKFRRNRLNQVSDKNVEEKFSFNQRRAETFFKNISEVYDNYETTFVNLLQELMIPDSVEEIMIVLGDTLFNPKCRFRLRKPQMDPCCQDSANKLRQSLNTILRSFLSCSRMDSIFSSMKTPSNMFILMELSSGRTPSTDWFIPIDHFVPAVVKKEVKISLNPPSLSSSSDNSEKSVDSSGINEKVDKESNWYRTKEIIKGFADFKIEGSSVFNYLLKL